MQVIYQNVRNDSAGVHQKTVLRYVEWFARNARKTGFPYGLIWGIVRLLGRALVSWVAEWIGSSTLVLDSLGGSKGKVVGSIPDDGK